MPARLAACLMAALIAGVAAVTVRADRLYGNAMLSYQHIEQPNGTTGKDDLTRETLLVNFEDVLFTKNQIRLAANLSRRELSFSDYHEFRPIYYFDLKSAGYAFQTSYSSYKRRSLVIGSDRTIDVYHRDWRSTAQFNYEKLPSLNIVYNRQRSFDKESVKRFNSRSRNLVLESNYVYKTVSLRTSFNDLKQRSDLPGGLDNHTRSYTGTVAISLPLRTFGFLSTTYNYYQTRQYSDESFGRKSLTHSATTLATLTPVRNLTLNLNYSGRFNTARAGLQEQDNANQNFSTQIAYQPLSYLNLRAIKAYQIGDETGAYQIVEYVTTSATLTRYLRNGVDTRITYSRTMFQQSNRLLPVRGDEGQVLENRRLDDYSLDTYYGSLGFTAYNYIKTYLDMSVSRDSDPADPIRRYQMTRSIDVRLEISRKMEGRVSFTSLYQGEKLRLDRSFSKNYNLGFTFYPERNLNMNLTYIYTSFLGGNRLRTGSFTGYVSYSFRRAFSVYFTLNQQTQRQATPLLDTDEFTEVTTRPQTINGQLLIYLSPKSTVSFGYLYSRTENRGGGRQTSRSLQSVLNIQI
ncbi:MAG: hypothetical protein OEW00_08555 [candidate division Zixibacteria bacterium]|nr:hypothetical protein [candidate division Zixibacteria bacterium]